MLAALAERSNGSALARLVCSPGGTPPGLRATRNEIPKKDQEGHGFTCAAAMYGILRLYPLKRASQSFSIGSELTTTPPCLVAAFLVTGEQNRIITVKRLTQQL